MDSDWNDSIQRNLDLKNNVLKYKKLASYKYTNSQKLSIYIVKLKSRNLIANIRSLHGSVSKYFLDKSDSDSILISYYSDDYDDWRFSFVKGEYLREFSDTGRLKVKEQISPVRRFSYLVGKHEPNHTAQSQLAPLLFEEKFRNPSINQLVEAFSVEKVSEFFDKYKSLNF